MMKNDPHLRSILIRAVWSAVGRDSATTTEPVMTEIADVISLIVDEIPDLEGFSDDEIFGGVATEEVELFNAFYGDSRTSGSDSATAYRLGDGFWYVMYRDASDETWLSAVTPEGKAQETFDRIQRDWFEAGGHSADQTAMTSFSALNPYIEAEVNRLIAARLSAKGLRSPA